MEMKTDVGTEPNAATAAGVVENPTVAEAGDMQLLGRSKQDTNLQSKWLGL